MQITESGGAWQTTIDSSGKIHIPAEARRKHNLSSGTPVVLMEDEQGSMRLLSLDEFTRNIQSYFLALEPADAIWSEELIKERKEEAARESGGA